MMRRGLLLLVVATGFPLAAEQAVPAFEVVSIKPSNRDLFSPNLEEEDPCSQALPRLTGRTLANSTTTLYALAALAYNPWKQSAGGCAFAMRVDLISGGPLWAKSDRYAVQMLLPEMADLAAYERLLVTGESPDVQRMLQAMLAERFKLKVRFERKDTPVFLLTLSETDATAKRKIAESTASQPIPERFSQGIFTSFPSTPDGRRFASVAFKQQSMARLAQRLGTAAQRPVLDETGLRGDFNFILEFDEAGVSRPTLFTALREQLGLRLQPSRAPIEALVIDSVERPTPD